MLFDVIVTNPPYRNSSKSKGPSHALWDKFIVKAFSILKKDGYLAAITPCGWRNNSKAFDNVKFIRKKQFEYLEIHNYNDGKKYFNCSTRFDIYIVKNCDSYKKTLIKDELGEEIYIDLKNFIFIPNYKIDYVYSFIAKEDEEKIDIIYKRCIFDIRKPYIVKKEDEQHKQKTIYTINLNGPKVFYSSKSCEKFNKPKVIINTNQPLSCFLDEKGEYGCSQFCIGIGGDEEYLKKIVDIFKNQKTNGFYKFMTATFLCDQKFNRHVWPLFRKNFYEQFI